jgi:hypothetical protein
MVHFGVSRNHVGGHQAVFTAVTATLRNSARPPQPFVQESSVMKAHATVLALLAAVTVGLSPMAASAEEAPWILLGYNLDGTVRCKADACVPIFLCCQGREME